MARKKLRRSILFFVVLKCMILTMVVALMAHDYDLAQPDWAEKTMASLTLEQKVAQLFVHGVVANPDDKEVEQTVALIKKYQLGGILFNVAATFETRQAHLVKQLELTNRYQGAATIPLLMVEDLEWGLSQRLHDVVRFPRNMTLGALSNEHLIYDMAYEVGRQCKEIGIHVNCAPVVDVNNNPQNPIIHDRSFGQSPQGVARKGTLFMKGLMDAGVLPTAKHFPGHGDTEVDSHVGLPCITHDMHRLRTIELHPFKHLIDVGVPAIMTGHLHIPYLQTTESTPSSLSSRVVTDVLKNDLGFKGLVLSDSLLMKGVSAHNDPVQAALKALHAGTDIIVQSADVVQAMNGLIQAVRDGVLTEKALNERVMKVLRLKHQLLTAGTRFVEPTTIFERINTPRAYALKKQLFEQAVTLVKNEKVLPLSHDAALIVIGEQEAPFAHELSALTRYVLPTQPTGSECEKVQAAVADNDTVIVGLLGMNKYSGQQFGIADTTRTLIKNLQAQGKSIILTLFGSPYSLSLFGDEAAIIVAYEDDEDAQRAAAHIITGDQEPQGNLPVSGSVAFPVGLGLRFHNKG